METTKQAIDNILMQQINGLHPQQITPEAELVRDLGADSLDQVEIAFAVEEKFDFEGEESDMDKIKTVGDLYDYVSAKVQA